MSPADILPTGEQARQANLYKLITQQYDAIKDTATFYTPSQRLGLQEPPTQTASPHPQLLKTTNRQQGLPTARVSPTPTNRTRSRAALKKTPHMVPRFLPGSQRNQQVPAATHNNHQPDFKTTTNPRLVQTIPHNQIQEPTHQPRPWMKRAPQPRRATARSPRTAPTLDWSKTKPVTNMTTFAPDPAHLLAHQIIKLEGTLHLLEAKSRFNRKLAARSACPQQNPGLWNLLMILLLFLSLRSTNAYTYTYYDCSQPSHLKVFDRLALCQQPPADDLNTHSPLEGWLILQEAASHEINGTSCEVRRSTFQGFCGVWGHTKLGGPPTVSATIPVSARECLEMVRTERFVTSTTPAGWPIRLNEETSFTEMTKGRIWYDNDQVQCEGVTVQLNGQVYLDTVLMNCKN